MLLNEQEQLLAGNAFMRRLAQQIHPENPALGQREVIRIMDAGARLSQHFDMDLVCLLTGAQADQAPLTQRRPPTGEQA
ncbi:hypothetical protein D3C84_1036750 [compost metagenome]